MKMFATTRLALVLAVMAVGAQAQTPQAVAQTCGVEARQICAGKAGTEFRQCVRASANAFSAACKQALADAHMKVKEIKSDGQH